MQRKCLLFIVQILTSFDITNIPLEETIKICADELSESKTKVNNLTEESFRLGWNWLT